jgi:hypothetical protein
VRVLAIDPGPHVGLAIWTDDPSFQAHEVTPAFVYDGNGEAWVMASDEVVVEDFYISGARGREANETIEMIGMLRHTARRHGKKFTTQKPGDAKFATNTKLKHLGWYEVGGSDHARSASRHLLTYLVTTGRLAASDVLPSS